MNNKKLATNILLAIMATGIIVPTTFAQEYTETITGNIEENDGYESVSSNSGDNFVYDFTKEDTTNIETENPVWIKEDSAENIEIKANKLNLTSTWTNGIIVGRAGTLNITAKELNILVQDNQNKWGVMGISFDKGVGEGEKSIVTINAPLKMRKDSKDDPWGIVGGSIYGGYPGEHSSQGGNEYYGTRWAPVGVSLGFGHGSKIDFNQPIDLAVKGIAVKTDPFYPPNETDVAAGITDYTTSTININKGGIIEVPHDKSDGYYAIANFGGTINVNFANGTPDKAVNSKILGNIIVAKEKDHSGDPYFYQDGLVNLGLVNNTSLWHGVVDNFGTDYAGPVNLYLQNGANWIHEAYSKTNGLDASHMPDASNPHYKEYDGKTYINEFYGGDSDANAGIIFQKDTAPIIINSYSGNAKVFYEHQNAGQNASDYAAGNVVINTAQASSKIDVLTNNTNIDTANNDLVNKALNTLAGKLFYNEAKNSINNLAGKVGIKEGLTASSATVNIKDITFNKTTGQGEYIVTPETKPALPEDPPTDSSSSSGDTEIFTEPIGVQYDGKYLEQGIKGPKKQGDGDGLVNSIYWHFTKNAEVNVTNKPSVDFSQDQYANKDVFTVQLDDGVKLTGNSVFNDGGKFSDAIKVQNGSRNMKFTGGSMEFNVKSDHRNAQGTETTGIKYYGGYDQRQGSTYQGVTGNVLFDTDVTFNVNGIDKAYGVVSIRDNNYDFNGNTIIKTNNDATESYSIYMPFYDSRVNINYNGGNVKDATKTVQLLGDIYTRDKTNRGKTHNAGTVNLGLSGENSLLHGIFNYDHNIQNTGKRWDITTAGYNNLIIQDGAKWINEKYGHEAYKQNFMQNGSIISTLKGGADDAHAGIIEMKGDEHITARNFEGVMKLRYTKNEAISDTSAANFFKGGEFRVFKAKQGAKVIAETTPDGIDMTSDEAVRGALNSLAGKVFYLGHIPNLYQDYLAPKAALKQDMTNTTAENNLTGVVKINEGLTSSSKELKFADISFHDEADKKGQGYIKAETPIQGEKTAAPEHDGNFTTPITGNKAADTEYVQAGVLGDDGVYHFTKDSTITIDSGTKSKNSSTINLSGNKLQDTVRIKIDEGKTLTLTAQNNSRADGIFANNKPLGDKPNLEITGDVNIKAISTGSRADGIYAGGSNVTINGNVTMVNADGTPAVDGKGRNYYEMTGLYAGGSGASLSTPAKLIINGNVDVYSKGNAIWSNLSNSEIHVAGGKLRIQDPKKEIYGIVATKAKAFVNVEKGASGTLAPGNKDVVIEGNVVLNDEYGNYNNANELSSINLALTTANSSLKGIIFNKSLPVKVLKYNGTRPGNINLWLQNGATWNVEAYGKVGTPSEFKDQTPTMLLTNLYGGADASKAGNILQTQKYNLNIDNFHGNMNVFYNHEDGTPTQMEGGDIHIKKASENSVINLNTKNNGIDTQNNEVVTNVFNGLAGKLFYEAYTTGERNLTGKLAIREGLTASSASINTGDVTFKEENGQGSYVPPQPPPEEKPEVPAIPSPENPPQDEHHDQAGGDTSGSGTTTGGSDTAGVGHEDSTVGGDTHEDTSHQGEGTGHNDGKTPDSSSEGTSGPSSGASGETGGTSGDQSSSGGAGTGSVGADGSGSGSGGSKPAVDEHKPIDSKPVDVHPNPGTNPNPDVNPNPETNPNTNVNPNPGTNPNPGVQPNPAIKPQPAPQEGKYETDVMLGTRSNVGSIILTAKQMGNDLNKRLGDIRFNKGSMGIWTHLDHGRDIYNANSVNAKFDYNEIHVGYDKKLNNGWIVGGEISHLNGDGKANFGANDTSLTSLGIYGTKVFADDSYVDIIAKTGRIKNDLHVATQDYDLSGKNKVEAHSLSAEYGKRITKENGFFIEPQVELSYLTLPTQDFTLTSTEDQKLQVHVDRYNALMARLGVGIGKVTKDSSVQLKFNLNHQFTGSTSISYLGENKKSVSFDDKNTFFTIGLSATQSIGDRFVLYSNIYKGFGGSYRQDLKLSLGGKFMF